MNLGGLLTVLCVLLVGAIAGATGVYWLLMHYIRARPGPFGAFFGGGLSALADACGRSHLHVYIPDLGHYSVPVESVAHALTHELPTWVEQRQRGLS